MRSGGLARTHVRRSHSLRVAARPRPQVTNVETTHYILGSAAGPHPYPMMVRDFQSVIGRETRAQCQEQFGGLPDIVMACVGGGSNAMGIFNEFVNEESVRLIGIEVRPIGLRRGGRAGAAGVEGGGGGQAGGGVPGSGHRAARADTMGRTAR